MSVQQAKWSWLTDDYEAGTAFITDDPYDSQRPIVDGLSKGAARAIVNAHNAALGAADRTGIALEAARDVVLQEGRYPAGRNTAAMAETFKSLVVVPKAALRRLELALNTVRP